MKSIVVWLLLFCSLCLFADENTNVIVRTDWSEPVSLRVLATGHDHAIRGRLLIVSGSEPAYGGPPTDNAAMTFIELQNVTGAQGQSVEFNFDVMKLNCSLTDQNGKSDPKPNAGPWGGRGPFAPCWVVLPYNSTVRLFVNGGSRIPLSVYPNGEPWSHWSISPSDTNAYYLSGTLEIRTRTNLDTNSPEGLRKLHQMFYDQHCKATVVFPKVRIPTNKK
jgi:hypothetical protein